jgi:murein DD-endopeptidase MepM/ murein hydrolase activator NlpD
MRKLILIILILSCTFIVPYNSFATTPAESLRQQINDTNLQLDAIDREIQKYQDQISTTSSQSKTLSSKIKELNATRTNLLKQKSLAQKKIDVTNVVIKAISSDIITKEKSIENSKQSLVFMIKSLNENDNELLVEKLLSQENLADASREYNNTISINEKISGYIDDLKSKKEVLNTSKNQKEQDKKSLGNLQTSLALKQQAVEATKKEQDSLLKTTQNKESEYKKLLAEQVKRRDAFEKSLSNYEDQLKFILNPKTLPQKGSDALSWPLDKVYITQLFGVTSSSGRLYKSGSHSGVDFRASVGTSVKSMGEGTVIGTGDTDIYCKGASFGKWVFIKYNNGLSSTYGHLSAISAKTGQNVSAGDIVALSGNTGHTTGPHLHVTVYASGGAKVDTVPSLSCSGKTFIMPIAATSSYLDPMLYLPKVTKSMIKS